MVERIIMDKGVNLGFEEKEGTLIGRRWVMIFIASRLVDQWL